MNYSISNNAEYGEYVTGVEVINDKSREAMRNASNASKPANTLKMFIQEGAVNYAQHDCPPPPDCRPTKSKKSARNCVP